MVKSMYELFPLTYEEILAISDSEMREYYLSLYDEKYKINRSNYLFYRDYLTYYPMLVVKKAKKKYTDAIGGGVIFPSSEYQFFKAFLYNHTRNCSYVSNIIRAEINSNYSFPTTLEQFENFCYRLDHAYELGLEEEYSIMSTYGFRLRKLNKR